MLTNHKCMTLAKMFPLNFRLTDPSSYFLGNSFGCLLCISEVTFPKWVLITPTVLNLYAPSIFHLLVVQTKNFRDILILSFSNTAHEIHLVLPSKDWVRS